MKLQSLIYNLKHWLKRYKLKHEAHTHGFRYRYYEANKSNKWPQV